MRMRFLEKLVTFVGLQMHYIEPAPKVKPRIRFSSCGIATVSSHFKDDPYGYDIAAEWVYWHNNKEWAKVSWWAVNYGRIYWE